MRKAVGRIRFLKSAKIGLVGALAINWPQVIRSALELPMTWLSRSRLSGFRCALMTIRDD
jgi:hypothetical protein